MMVAVSASEPSVLILLNGSRAVARGTLHALLPHDEFLVLE